jgi:hypothetical protein
MAKLQPYCQKEFLFEVRAIEAHRAQRADSGGGSNFCALAPLAGTNS